MNVAELKAAIQAVIGAIEETAQAVGHAQQVDEIAASCAQAVDLAQRAADLNVATLQDTETGGMVANLLSPSEGVIDKVTNCRAMINEYREDLQEAYNWLTVASERLSAYMAALGG